jgi:hypothetical protein
VTLFEDSYLVFGKLGVRPLSRVDNAIQLNVNGGCRIFSTMKTVWTNLQKHD